MRVIGGIHRGRRLRTLAGLAVRPTSDRLRETLFNILAPMIRGARALDLCAGSGAVGIEALSRGARQAIFVDRSRQACALIEENLQTLGITESATVMAREAIAALKRFQAEGEQFDLIFFDPPYASALYESAMRCLSSGELLTEEGRLIVEYPSKIPPADAYGALRAYRHLRQGQSALAFYRIESFSLPGSLAARNESSSEKDTNKHGCD